MLDVLSDTYRIATRMDAFDAQWATNEKPACPTQVQRGWLSRVKVWFKRRRDNLRAREDVRRLSDHQLRDIGLTRHELIRGINAQR